MQSENIGHGKQVIISYWYQLKIPLASLLLSCILLYYYNNMKGIGWIISLFPFLLSVSVSQVYIEHRQVKLYVIGF